MAKIKYFTEGNAIRRQQQVAILTFSHLIIVFNFKSHNLTVKMYIIFLR